MPKVRAYRDHVFLVLHAPELGSGGHVHYVELDQFIGPRWLVTVHGPVNPAVSTETSLRQTRGVLRRIEAGRLRPRSGFELAYAIVSALAQCQEAFVETVTREVWPLEQRVTSGRLGDPSGSWRSWWPPATPCWRWPTWPPWATRSTSRCRPGPGHPPARQPLVADLVDQFDRVAGVADGQIATWRG